MSIESRSRQYGKVFDHWQIKEFLGSGSGGKTAVFCLVRSDSGWGVSALKVINLIEERGDIETLSDYRKHEYEYAREECSKNAEQEVRLMDDLRGNTNIVDYLDHTFVDWSDESGFGRDLLIRMELLKDLRSEIRSGKMFTEREVLKIGRDICVALIRCHRKNILHRDVKPENIFRNKDGDYKLGDFGVSRVLDTCPGAVASTGIGTYEYWPAEQMTGRYDKRVDIYSLGLVLYELCNQNHLPFASSTYATSKEVSLRLAGEPLLPPSDASTMLTHVILKACAFDPNERYQTAEELLKALNHVIRGSQTVSEPKTTKPTQKKVQPKEAYNTIPAEPTADKASSSYYATIPAGSDEQSVDQPFSTEPARKKSYTTEPTKKHSPRYATQKADYTTQRHLPIFWIVVALLGLCLVAFGVGSLLARTSGSEELYGDDSHMENGNFYEDAKESTVPIETTLETLLGQDTTEALNENTTNDATEVPSTVDSIEVANQRRYAYAETLLAEGKTLEAVLEFRKLGDYKDSAKRCFDIQIRQNPQNSTISAGGATVALRLDGTAIATGGDNAYNQWYVTNWDWKDLVSISAGGVRTLGLRADGTVVNAGWSDGGKYSTGNWKNIVAVAAGGTTALGLKSDGTVIVTGPNYRGENNVGSWSNIVAIAAGTNHTVGLKADGVVVAAGDNTFGACDVEDWTDIVAIAAGGIYTMGLKADGTVLSTRYDTSGWQDIIAIAAGSGHILGLRADGTVIATGSNFNGECDVDHWTDIVAISASTISMGLKADGTVVAVGGSDAKQRNVSGWSEIRLPSYSSNNLPQSVSDGQLVANNEGYRYTGKIIRSNTVNVRTESSTSSPIATSLKNGDAIVIYETTIAENMAWGRCDAGWVYLYYVDLTPVTNGAVDARVVYNDNTIIYTDVDCNGVAGTYSRMSVVDIYEISGKMARTERGWVNTDNLL